MYPRIVFIIVFGERQNYGNNKILETISVELGGIALSADIKFISSHWRLVQAYINNKAEHQFDAPLYYLFILEYNLLFLDSHTGRNYLFAICRHDALCHLLDIVKGDRIQY